MKVKKLKMSKKVRLLISIMLFFLIWVGYLLSPIYSVEGVYRSYLAQTLSGHFKGYLCFRGENVYAVNLSTESPSGNNAKFVGSCKRIGGRRYKVTNADKIYFTFKVGLFGIELVDDNVGILPIYDSFPFNEGLKTILPTTLHLVNKEVDKVAKVSP